MNAMEVLQRVVSVPTAPFHEHAVVATITALLDEVDVAWRRDRWGNVIARVQRGAPRRPLALVAHTDHPAFELTGAPVNGRWPARLLGGVPAACFDRDVAVVVRPLHAEPVRGRVVGARSHDDGRRVDLEIVLDESEAEAGDFGVWDVTPFELQDDLVVARAIDDLAGCAAIVAALATLADGNDDVDVFGVFTRAEEVGLVGAEALFTSRALPADTLVVSIEASKALPGAVQGGGPVIRAGDRAFTFDETAESVLRRAAAAIGGDVVGRGPQARPVQRQLMTGGRCEAGAALRNGYAATGLALPLGNYHNVTDDLRIAAETIHRQDYLTAVDLLAESARHVSPAPDSEPATAAGLGEDLAARLEATASATADATR